MKSSKWWVLYLVLSLQLATPNQVLAWESRAETEAAAPTGGFRASRAQALSGAQASAAVNLDLSSRTASLTAGNYIGTNPVTINVGGVNRQVGAQDMLTPAELVAASQVAGGGRQTLQLGPQGNAVAGRFSLSGQLAQEIGHLVVPQGVKLYQDFGNLANLAASGNLTNQGRIYAFSTDQQVTSASLSALNIFNQTGALITTVIPSGGLPRGMMSGAVPVADLGLNLNAVNDIVNAGSIVSAGNLNLYAGGSIVNALPLNDAQGFVPTMQAAGSVNLLSATITNKGVVASLGGNININSLAPANILVNAAGGTFEALAGDINVRESGFNLNNNIAMNGGNYFSRNLNLYSGAGAVDLNVDQVSGKVNTSAQIAHISAATPVLVLGEQCITGDPTYANTGDINIAGGLTITGGSLAIVAGGDIEATSSSAKITNNGANILLIAGADCVSGCGGGGTSLSGTDPSGATTGTITVSFVGGAGGNIDFQTSTQATVIDSSSGSGAGGNVTLVAVANGATGGNVLLQNGGTGGAIDTSGTGANGGAVSIIAGALSGTTLTVGDITTTGGSVSLQTATPVVIGTLTINTLGDIASGAIAAGTMQEASMTVGGTVNTGPGTAGAGSVLMLAGSDITFSNINTSSTAGAGGNILAGAGFASTNSGTSILVTGASSVGGSITQSVGATTLQTSSTAGSGGNLTFLAASGSGGGSGNISLLGSVAIATGGSGATTNGSVMMIAGATSGATSITTGAINTTGGSAGNGNIMLASATPDIMCPGCSTQVVTITNNNIAGGYFGGGVLQSPGISAGALTTSNSFVQLYSTGSISTGAITACSGCQFSGQNTTVVVPSGVTPANMTIQTVANGSIFVTNATLNPSNSLTLISQGTGGVYASWPLQTNTLTMVSASGDIMSISNDNRLQVTASNLTMATAGNVYVKNLSTGTLTGLLAGNVFDYSNLVGNTIVTGSVSGAFVVLNAAGTFTTQSGASVSASSLLTLRSGSTVTIASGTLTGNASSVNASGATLNIFGTGSISISGALSSNGNGTGNGGNIFLMSSTGSVSVGALNTNGVNGGNIIIGSASGITTSAIDTSGTGSGIGGQMVGWTGNSGNAATISVGQINTSGTSGGLVQLVNSAANTSSTNLTVSGTINTDASGLNGVAGPIALVASGAISASSAITARANANGSSTTALGGSVFISSGGTGATAITTGTINTSATNNGAGDRAGNIILLTSAGTSAPNPTNITHGAFTQTGGTAGTNISYGLNGASSTLPSSLNVTPTANINIRPGGYQSASGSFISLSVNTNGDRQMVVPINIGATGTSLRLTSVNPVSAAGGDNINFVLAGDLITNGVLATSGSTTRFGLLTTGTVTLGAALSVNSLNDANIVALAGISGPGFNFSVNAGRNIFLPQTGINTNSGSGAGGAVMLNAGSSIVASTIFSYSTSTAGGAVNLNAGSSVLLEKIYSHSQGSGVGGAININAGSNIVVLAPSGGDIQTSADNNSAGSLTMRAGGVLAIGNILAVGYSGAGGAVTLSAGSSLSSLYLLTDGLNGNGGNISLNSGSTISISYIDTLANSGATNAGSVTMNAGSTIRTADIGTTSTGGNGGNIMLLSLQGGIFINGSLMTRTTSGAQAGSVSLVALNEVNVNLTNGITNNGITATGGSAGSVGGNLFISSGSSNSNAVKVGRVDTSSAATGGAGRIFLGANVSGTNGASGTGNANIQFTLFSANGTSTTPNPYLFYNGNPSTITSSTTVFVQTGNVTIFPGVYTSDIGSSGSPVAITLDLGGDSRTLVPLASTGNIYLSGFVADNTVGGAAAYQNNGYNTNIVSSGASGITLSGNLSASPFAGGTAAPISLLALGTGGISQSGTVSVTGLSASLYAPSLSRSGTLTFATGNVAMNVNTITSSGTMSTSAGTLSLLTTSITNTGTISASSTLSIQSGCCNLTISGATSTLSGSSISLDSGGTVNANQTNWTGTVSGSAANVFTLTAAGNVTTGAITGANGINLVTTAGNLTLNGTVSSNGGGVTLAANNSSGTNGILTIAGSIGTVALAGNSGNLAVVGSQQIVSATGIGSINTGSSTGNGGSILLIGDSNFTYNTGTNTITFSGGGQGTNQIDLTVGGGITSVTSASTFTNGSGGAITFVTPYQGGQYRPILLGTAPVTSGGNGTGTNGDMRILASNSGAMINPGITVGNVDTTGATGGGGNIYIVADRTDISGTMTIRNGAIVTGSFSTFSIPGFGQAIMFGPITTGTLTASNNAATPTTVIYVADAQGLITTSTITNNAAASGNSGGRIIVNSFTGTYFVNGNIVANGSGTGNGGQVNLGSTFSGGSVIIDSSATTAGVKGTVTANGGTSAGAGGGTVTVSFSTSLSIPATSNIVVNPSASGGPGGSITITSFGGGLTIPNGTWAVDAVGPGNFNGGTLSLTTGTLSITGGTNLQLSANSAGTGNGGSVGLTTRGATSDVVVGAGQITFSATGGFVSSATGNGGNITVGAGRNLTFDPAGVTAGPLGTNGRGTAYNLSAGLGAVGNLQVNGSLNGDGVGTGGGGNISISYRDDDTNFPSQQPFVIGDTVTNSGVTGNITSNAPGSGTGGNITISNNSQVVGHTGLFVTLTGNITASTGSGSLGNISFNDPAHFVWVQGAGTLVGRVSASAGQALFDPGNNTVFTVGTITTTAGSASFDLTASGASMVVPVGSSINASGPGGSIFINTASLTHNGSMISSFSGGTIDISNVGTGTGLTLSGNGTMTQSGGGAAIIRLRAFGAFTLAVNSSYTYDAGSSGTVQIMAESAGGAITFGNGSVQTAQGSSAVRVSSQSITFGNGATITTNKASSTGITVDTFGAANPLQLTLPDNNTATLQTSGASLNITPTSGQTLTFAKTAGSNTATLSIVGGTLTTTTTNVNTTIDGSVVVTSNNNITLNVNNASLLNSGTVSTTTSGDTIAVQSTSGLTVGGNGSGSFTQSSNGSGITFSVTGNNTLSFTASQTVSSNFNVNLTASSSSAVVNIGNSVILNNPQSGTFNITTPALTLGSSSTISSNGGNYNIGFASGSSGGLVITVPDNSTATISGGAFQVESVAGQTVTFTKTVSASDATLFFTSSTSGLTVVSDTGITINPQVILSGNRAMILRSSNGTITNDGTVAATGTGFVTVQSLSGGLTLAGTGTYSVAGSAGINASLTTGDNLNITGSHTWSPGSGSLFLSAIQSGGSITFGNGSVQTISNGSGVTITTNSVVAFGMDATITNNSTAALTITSLGPLILRAQDGSDATINNNGGAIIITPNSGQSLTFAKTAGGGSATFFLNGGALSTTTNSAATTIDPSVIIQSNNSVTLNINDSTFTNNGTLRSSASGNSITIQSSSTLSLDGTTGIYDQTGGGTTRFLATAVGGTITLLANTIQTVAGGNAILIGTRNLALQDDSLLTASGASAITVNTNGVTVPLQITAPDDSTGTIQTTGGSIGVSTTAGQAITFAKSGAGGGARLELNGGPVTVSSSSADTTINSGVTVCCADNTLTFTVTNANFVNNGSVCTETSGDTITISANNVTTGTITAVGSLIDINANGTLTVSNPVSTTGLGTVDLSTTSNGSVVVNASITGASGVTITTNGTGTVSSAVSTVISSTNSPIAIAARNIAFSGTLNAGSNFVYYRPNSTAAITIGGGAGPFQVTAANIAAVTSQYLAIGLTPSLGMASGGVTVAGPIDISSSGPTTSLQIYNMGTYSANGQTVTLGSQLLHVSVFGTVDTGSVNGNGSASFESFANITVSGAITAGATGSIGLSSFGGTVTLNASVGGGTFTGVGNTSTLAIIQNAGVVSGTSAIFTATTGNIGNIGQPILTSTSNLVANTVGNVYISNSGAGGALTVSNAIGPGTSSGADFSITNDQAITVSGAISATGLLTLQTTANNGGISINTNSSGANGVVLSAHGTGAVSVASSMSLSSTDAPISITADDVSFSGSVNAGNGTVSLVPNGAKSITVGGAGGVFSVLGSDLTAITAGTLVVGTTAQAGGFTVAGSLNVSGAGPAGAYNLVFNNGGNYTAAGQTITLGTKTLTVNALGTLNTGAVTGGNTTVSMTGGTAMTVSAAVTVTAGGSVTLATSNNGNITISGNVGGGTTTNIDAHGGGDLIRSGNFTVSGATVNLLSGSGDIGQSGTLIQTATGDLNFATTGSVYVTNAGSVSLGAFSTLNTLTLSVTGGGSLTVSGDVSADIFTLTAATISVPLGVTVNADDTGDFETNQMTVNGDLVGGNILRVSDQGNGLVLQGNGSYTATAGTIVLDATGGNSILFDGAMSFDGAAITISSSGVGNSVELAAGATPSFASLTQVNFNTHALTMGADSILDATGSPNVRFGAIGAPSFTLTLPADDVATIEMANNRILYFNNFPLPSGPTLITKLPGAGTGELILSTPNGTTIFGGIDSVTVDSGVRLSSNGQIALQPRGTVSATLTIDGQIVSTGTGNSAISLFGEAPEFTLTGSGSILAASGSGAVAIVGSISPVANAVMHIGGTLTFDAGASNVVQFASADNASQSLVVDAGAVVTIESGSDVRFAAPNFEMEALASIVASGASDITIDALVGNFPLQVTLPNGSQANIATSGGNINVIGRGINFTKTAGALEATLNVSGGPVFIETSTTGDITIQPLVELCCSDNTLSIEANTGSITNEGTICGTSVTMSARSIDQDGTVTVQPGGTASLSTVSGGTGNISLGGNVGGGASVSISANGSGTITQTSGTLSATGTVTLSSGSGDIGQSGASIQTAAGTLNFSTTGSVYITNAGNLNLGAFSTANTLQLATLSNGSITIGGNLSAGTMTLDADGAGTITRSGNFTLTATTLNLTSDSGDIGQSGTPIQVDTDNLSFATTGSVYIRNAGDFTVGGFSTTNTLELSTSSGGSITIGGNLSAGTMTLDADGAGTITRSGNFTLTATTLNLTSDSGDIGQSGTPIQVDTDNLSFATTGSVYIRNAGDFTVGGFSTTNTLELSTSSGGSITIGGNLSAGSMTLDADGAGTITRSGNFTLTATTLNLTSDTGDIGQSGTPIQVDTDNLSFATTGSVYIRNVGDFTVGGFSTTNTLELSTSSGGSITIGGNLSAGTMTLDADGAGTITRSGNFTLTATTLNLTSDSGDIGQSGTPIQVDTDNLSFATTGSVYIRNVGDFTVGAFSTTNTLELSTSSGGSITIGGNLSAGSMTLDADGAGTITRSGNFTLTATTLSLFSDSGDIGQSGTPIQTDVNDLNFGTTGSVYITNAGDLGVDGFSSAGTLQLATSSNGSISIDGSLSAATLILDADGTGTITRSGNFTLTAGDLTLNSDSGDIGTQAIPLRTAADNLSTNTLGNVYILQQGDLNLNASTIGGELSLDVDGIFSTAGTINTGNASIITNTFINANAINANLPGGTITVNSHSGQALDVSGGGTITALGGVSFTAAPNTILNFSGDQTITGPSFLTTAGDNGIVAVALGSVVTNIGDMTVTTHQIDNQAGLQPTGTFTFNQINPPPPPPPPTPSTPTITTVTTTTDLSSIQTFSTSRSAGIESTVISTDVNQGSTGGSLASTFGSSLSGPGTAQPGAGMPTIANGELLGLPGTLPNVDGDNNNPLFPLGGGVINTGDIPLLSTLVEQVTAAQNTVPGVIGGRAGRRLGGKVTNGQLAQSQTISTKDDSSQHGSFGQPILVSPARSNLVLFTAANQVFSGPIGGDNDTAVSGTPGTLITTDSDRIVLHTGRLLADTGGKSAVIYTGAGAVTINADAAAVIEVKVGAPVRIMAVAGDGDSPTSVIMPDGMKTGLQPGQELIVGQRDLTSEDLIPTDGIDRAITGGIQVQSRKAEKDEFSLEEFMSKEIMIAGMTVRLGGSKLRGKLVKAARMQEEDRRRRLAKGEKDSKRKIAAPVLAPANSDQQSEPLKMFAEGGSLFTLEKPNLLAIERGSIFFNMPQATTLRTALGYVHGNRGSLVMISARPGQMRVEACSGPDMVNAIAAGTKIDLGVARELLVTDHRPTKSEAIPRDGVGRRQITAYALNDRFSAVVGDFSIATLLNSANCLKALRQPSSPRDLALREKLIKVAAAVHHVSGNKGRYFMAPKEAADVPDWPFLTVPSKDGMVPLLKAFARDNAKSRYAEFE